jgi:hypothetical protein
LIQTHGCILVRETLGHRDVRGVGMVAAKFRRNFFGNWKLLAARHCRFPSNSVSAHSHDDYLVDALRLLKQGPDIIRIQPAVAPLLTPSAEELVSLKSAIGELERVDMNGEAIQLRSLERKVRALIPSDRTLRLATDEEALLEAMGFAARPGPRPSMNEAVDLAISEAIKGPFELRIQYQGRGDTKPSWRTIEPLGLLLGSRRYLVGIDTAKRDGRYRHYRVEDIMEAQVQARVFAYPDDFDLREYATRAFGSYHHEAEYGEVVWRFSPEAADRAARFQFHPSQEIEHLDDGAMLVRFSHASCNMKFRTSSLTSTFSTIPLRYGSKRASALRKA